MTDIFRFIAIILAFLPYVAAAAGPAFASDYSAREATLPAQVTSMLRSDSLTADERNALMMLYAYMPMSDVTNRTPQFYLMECVRPALKTRAVTPWGQNIPDELFYHYVLPLRVNNEALDSHRALFFAELWPRISACPSMADAILEINHWCHEKASYQPSDGRTHSPLQTVSSAIGRCGEESTFAVAALRAAGIPARQVYTPRWAHTDDNHAWVEAWADGQWHFLGACEPEAVLDLAWFNQPAARGMLMHARTFGLYRGKGEVLAIQNGNTDINVTGNYAPVDSVTVTVLDATGKPVANAEVSFRIYNYAEFYPIATKTTDSSGRAALIAGCGDIVAWARIPETGLAAMALIKGDDSPRKATLIPGELPATGHRFTIVPPPDRGATTPPVTESQRAINAQRLIHEDSLRHTYISSWPDSASISHTAVAIGVDFDRLRPLLEKSRGNTSVIIDFLSSCPRARLSEALIMLEALPPKDLTDITLPVLTDILSNIPKRQFNLSDADYATWQLSPRVSYEELTPYRQFFNTAFTAGKRAEYRNNPHKWVQWITDNIVDTLSWYPAQASMSPQGVFANRATSPLSRDIFFVAGARCFGIPARLCPISSVPQYLTSHGWIDVNFNHTDSTPPAVSPGYLKLSYRPEGSGAVATPRYYTHFTISKIVDGAPQLLSFPDFCSIEEEFSTPVSLSPGQYMLTSGRRLADGSVLAVMDFFQIAPQQTTDVNLKIGVDTTRLQVIGTLDAELPYLPANASEPTSLLSTAGRGYYVVGLMDCDTEPSHHAINDLIAASAELDSLGRTIFLLYPDQKSLPVATPSMPRCVTIGTDINHTVEQALLQGLYIESPGDGRPVFAIADSFGRVVYICRGYTIGLGNRLAELLRSL